MKLCQLGSYLRKGSRANNNTTFLFGMCVYTSLANSPDQSNLYTHCLKYFKSTSANECVSLID